MASNLLKLIRSVLFGLKSRTDRIRAAICIARTHTDLLGGAIALSLVVLTILDVAGNTLVDVVTAIFFSFHHDSTLLSRIVLFCAVFQILFFGNGGFPHGTFYHC